MTKLALTLLCLILLLAGIAALALRLRSGSILAHTPAPSRMKTFPRLFLWAWEREENLQFINPREVGVAFLAATVTLRGEEVIEHPRLQPLRIPDGTTLIAVVRIETARDPQPALSDKQRASLAELLIKFTRGQNISALQIDFDVTMSERKFYGDLLRDVRRSMPAAMPLSMTALASWCVYDEWLDELPVDEAVPMLFQMGLDKKRINSYLDAGGELRAPLCRSSLGISTDEARASFKHTERVYIFNSQPWSETTVRQALERSRNEKPVVP
ncbi:MAG: DUF3142 domain-containing protein [Acidobacteria bacterium]|nr:DUF3142 domain-containing protein [Acidobacteriota bacterium]